MTLRHKLIEVAGEALAAHEAKVYGGQVMNYPCIREAATAAVDAILEALKEPSEEMMGPILPGYDGSQDTQRIAIWREMLSAVSAQ